jgi:hypothetical protein
LDSELIPFPDGPADPGVNSIDDIRNTIDSWRSYS